LKIDGVAFRKWEGLNVCITDYLPIKDSIVKGGEASPTLDKLEIYRGGPQTVLDSSHVDLFPILLRC